MDDRVKFSATVKFDRLGKWQEPIVEAIHRAMPGAKTYCALPQGNVGLWITSSAFENLQECQREERVREIISSLGRGVVDLLSSFHLYTPEEQAGFDRTAAFNECFQDVTSIGIALYSGQIRSPLLGYARNGVTESACDLE